MSFVAPSQRRLVWPVAIALAATMLVALSLYLPTRTPSVDTSDPIAAPGVAQADWEVKVFPAGVAGTGKLTKSMKARIAAQREPLNALLREVYDSTFLAPSEMKAAIGRHFSKAAAAQALGSKIGLPRGAREVQIEQRSARVGIHVQGASRAAAHVKITGRATVDGRALRFEHDASLWLERAKTDWQVIGFDVVQGPKKAGKARAKARK
jgi:hypothetical protein